jgi:hypothetical protein
MDRQQKLRERRYQLRLTALDMLICVAAVTGIILIRSTYADLALLFVVFMAAPDAYRRW